MTLGAKLAELRQAAGFSQSQAARASGVPARAIQNYEQDRTGIGLEAAFRLADAYGFDVNDLRPYLLPPASP